MLSWKVFLSYFLQSGHLVSTLPSPILFCSTPESPRASTVMLTTWWLSWAWAIFSLKVKRWRPLAGPVFLLVHVELCQPLSSSALHTSLHRLEGGNSLKEAVKRTWELLSLPRSRSPAESRRGSGCGQPGELCSASLSYCRSATAFARHVPAPVSTQWGGKCTCVGFSWPRVMCACLCALFIVKDP